ncbi:MAG: FIST N-terminal domain-containing protein [Dehalococcoidia bacterium]
MATFAGLGTAHDWRLALDQALGEGAPGSADAVFVFASSHYLAAFGDILGVVQERLRPKTLLGCSGQAVIGTGREMEGVPALSVLSLRLPGAMLRAFHITQEFLALAEAPEAWHEALGLRPEAVNAWVILADPFTFDSEALLARLSSAYPGVPLVGGMASSAGVGQHTQLFLGSEVHHSGALLLAIGGAWGVRPVVSQGAAPIGETWTITEADRNIVRAIGGRPPLEVLVDTLRALPPDVQQRASRNLLVGLAMDEYRDEFRRGDFLIRNLLGADQASGIVAIGDVPRVGQTLQFQVRDGNAADEELREMLIEARAGLDAREPAGGLLFACNGRGMGLFGSANHDAQAIEREFAGLPVAGFFCNGEIGPVGGRNYLHGFTASIALFVPVA